uniref:Uncharacterized protein n=1 Tax=Arundo donax TaxID=35708 RepID=A0A0A9B3E7_ARUDO
MGNRVWDRD